MNRSAYKKIEKLFREKYGINNGLPISKKCLNKILR